MAEETRLSRHDGRTNGASDAEVARMRADIEMTRAAMGDTLQQIQERLSPARLKEQAKETVREATIGRVKKMARNAGDRASDAGRGLADVVRDNPVPFALIGIGAGWLLMNARKRNSHHYDYNREQLLTERPAIGYESGYAEYESETRSAGPGRVERAKDTIGNVVHNVEEKVSNAAHAVGERASNVAHSLRDHVSDVPGAVSAQAGGIADKASSLRGRVSERASNVRASVQQRAQRARYQYEETPWMGAAVAIGLGMAAGLAIPGTTREDELLGARRDELLDRARDRVRDKIQAVRTVAEEVIQDTKTAATESVREHAREEGLVQSEEMR